MTENEHLLLCLAEECDEVGQRVMKALRFGLGEVQPGQPFTNAERITRDEALATARACARAVTDSIVAGAPIARDNAG